MKRRTGLHVTVLCLNTLMFSACSNSDSPTQPATAGSTANPPATQAGQTAPTGANAGATSAAGNRGTVPTAGSGGIGVGTTGGTGAVAAAGAAGGTSASNDNSCAGAATGAAADLHAAAAKILIPADMTSKGTCSFSSCHDSSAKKAKLIFDYTNTDLKALLVDKPACEATTYTLIASGGGDAALAKSWIWQKLSSTADASGTLIVKPEWGTPTNCGQSDGFGVRMPMSGDRLDDTKLGAIKAWICAGAPAPM